MANKSNDILLPDRVENLERYCNGDRGVVSLCYGYGKDYCPRSCDYAKAQNGLAEVEKRKRVTSYW